MTTDIKYPLTVRDYGDGQTIKLSQSGSFNEFRGDTPNGPWADTLNAVVERIERRQAAERNAKKLKPSIPVILILSRKGQDRFGPGATGPGLIHATYTGVNHQTGKATFKTTAHNPGFEWQKNIEAAFKADQQTEANTFLNALIAQRTADEALRKARVPAVDIREIHHRSYIESRIDVEQANALIKKVAALLGQPFEDDES